MGQRLGCGGTDQKEKGLVDMANSVVISGRRGYEGLNGNGKNTRKIKKINMEKSLYSFALQCNHKMKLRK